MRLVVLGFDSYIAGHVLAAAKAAELETVALAFDADVTDVLRPDDTVINFALHPAYKSGPYDEAFDCDLRVARIAAKIGAQIVMLSSRKVYPEQARWGALESGNHSGDGSAYGNNKATTEERLRAIADAKLAIFRLANICGYEYTPEAPRRTFFGIMLQTLKSEDLIRFDMHPDTRRDFLPVEYCARALIHALKYEPRGVYNLGVGAPVRCGEIASWIFEGFGAGRLVVDPPVIRDEFYLNMEKWKAAFGHSPLCVDDLRAYCVGIGQKLRCEKS